MINQFTSIHSGSTDLSSFRVGVSPVGRKAIAGNDGTETAVAVKPARKAPVEEVIANHTAIKANHRLCAAYVFQSILTGLPLLAVDLVITACGLLGSSYLVNLSQGHELFNPGVWLQLPALLMLQALMMSVHQLYPGAGVSPVVELRGIVRSTLLALLCLSAMNVVLGQLPRIEFVIFACTALAVAVSLPVARWLMRYWLAGTRWWGLRMLLIGQHDDCIATQRQLNQRRPSGLIAVGYTCDGNDIEGLALLDDNLLGRSAESAKVARDYLAPVAGLVSPEGALRTDRLIFQFPSVVWIDIASAARKELDTSRLPQVITTSRNMPFLRFVPRLCKRALDLAICIPGLILLAVPMGLIALAIKYFSPGPVIYGSRRVGQHGKEFKMWKFRSMVPDADKVLEEKLASDPQARAEWERDAKLKSDPRIIPGIGNLLRRWSLDEFPQLWNVLVGEMSLVGPRPVPPNEIVRYQDHYYEYTQMWPGMTGLWQVSGRNDTSFDTRVFLVHHYARNWSPWLDFWVLFNTPAVVISKSGAY